MRRLLVACALPVLLCAELPVAVEAADPQAAPGAGTRIELGTSRELFVDDHLLDRTTGAALRMHRPVPQDVVIVCDAPWEGNTSAYFTVFRDGELFRMYYRGWHWDEAAKRPAHPEFTCYAESRDGIRWAKPPLGLFEFAGSKENNIVWTGEGTHNFTPFKDDNPDCDPAVRYKALSGSFRRGLHAYGSPDGIRWERLAADPVITDGDFDSQNLAFWDAHRGCYVEYHRKSRNGARDIMTSTSSDFLHWTKPVFLDYGDAPREHLYTNAVRPYFRAPHLLLGFPTRFQPKTMQVEPIPMTSRDGLHFRRWPEPLIPIDAPAERDGNRSNYMVNALVELPGRPGELSVYATERYYAGPGSRVRRFAFRTDGFVSLHAEGQGEIVTKPLTFAGKSLSLNYVAQPEGSVRVELLDADGKTLSGFAAADGPVLRGEAVDGPVRWKGTLADLAGRPVRLRILLDRADVYALQFAP